MKAPAPVLDQRAGGGSVGFALAAVANYLVRATRPPRDADPVSPWMLQALAARYDPWTGDEDAGVEARAALKGWHAHGVCREALWTGPLQKNEPTLTRARVDDAALRPLARYGRVDRQGLSDLQAAVAQSGIVFATAWIHPGWFSPRSDGTVVPSSERVGCHAFALVAYDLDGFWIQNSWGRDWGRDGFGYLTYDDWLMHGADAWSAQIAPPARLPLATHHQRASRLTDCSPAYSELRAHVVGIDDDGRLREAGPYGNSKGDVEAILRNDFARVTATWRHKRLLLIAPSGLASEAAALRQLRAGLPCYLSRQVYPIALLWRRDLRAQLQALVDAQQPANAPIDGASSEARDDAVERRVRASGSGFWEALKRGAWTASMSPAGAARVLAGHLAHLSAIDPAMEVHCWAYGAGVLMLAPFVELLTAHGQIRGGALGAANGFSLPVQSCGLVAPACTSAAFHESVATALNTGALRRLQLFQISVSATPEPFLDGYGRSFLQLVSHTLEAQPRIPGLRAGTALLGQEGAGQDARMQSYLARRQLTISTLSRSPTLADDPDHVLAHLPDPVGESVRESELLGIAEPAMPYPKPRRRV